MAARYRKKSFITFLSQDSWQTYREVGTQNYRVFIVKIARCRRENLQLKKIVFTFIIALMFIAFAANTAFADSEVIKVNTELGTVSINYDTADYSDLKVVVKKGSEKYFYNLYSAIEELPLQMGSGVYAVGLYQKKDGKKYKLVTSKKFELDLDSDKVFLASVQNVNLDSNSQAIQLAKELTADSESDSEKFEAIYNYVINNVEYDYSKAATVKSGYLPNADQTLANGNGICYDYASLTAVMLRSVGVPTKLVEGQSSYTSAYHAWNEVLVDGQWIVVDTTADSAYNVNGIEYSVEKSSSDYNAAKVF
jgi:transglutaminase-like putative cysteine protease